MKQLGASIHHGNSLSHVVTIGGEWILRPLGFRRRRVHFQGIDMEVLEGRGRGGPDVVLLHGLGDRNSTWHRVMWRLRLGNWGRIFAPDLVGFGRTLLPSDRTMPSLDEGLDLLDGFLSELTDERPVLVGNSLGAWLGWRYLLRYPQSISGCLMLAPGGFMQPEELWQVIQRFLTGEPDDMTRAIIGDARPEMRFFARRIIGKMLQSPMLEVVCRQDSKHLLHEAGDLAPYVDRLRCLWGTLDTLMPESGRYALYQELGDHLVVEQVGHAPQQTQPGLVVRELVKLANQIKQSEPSAQAGERGHRHVEPRDVPEQQLRV